MFASFDGIPPFADWASCTSSWTAFTHKTFILRLVASRATFGTASSKKSACSTTRRSNPRTQHTPASAGIAQRASPRVALALQVCRKITKLAHERALADDIMPCADRARADVSSERNDVPPSPVAGPSPAAHPPSRFSFHGPHLTSLDVSRGVAAAVKS